MTSSEIALVKNSFALVQPIASQAAALFYARLFELDPSLRPLFRGDMTEQGKKLMQVLALVVSSLDRLDAILPAVRQVGAKHNTYGVREDHYATVGAALLWTLGKGLGPAFTPEVRDAWTTAYTLLANTMIEAANAARTPVAA